MMTPPWLNWVLLEPRSDMLRGKTSLPFWTDFRFCWRASHRPKGSGSIQGFLKTVSFMTSGELPSIPRERNICCVSLQCINTALTLINLTKNRPIIHCDKWIAWVKLFNYFFQHNSHTASHLPQRWQGWLRRKGGRPIIQSQKKSSGCGNQHPQTPLRQMSL